MHAFNIHQLMQLHIVCCMISVVHTSGKCCVSDVLYQLWKLYGYYIIQIFYEQSICCTYMRLLPPVQVMYLHLTGKIPISASCRVLTQSQQEQDAATNYAGSTRACSGQGLCLCYKLNVTLRAYIQAIYQPILYYVYMMLCLESGMLLV